MVTVTTSEFKGNPVITLEQSDGLRFPVRLTFGMTKVRMILSAIAALQAFAAKHDKVKEIA